MMQLMIGRTARRFCRQQWGSQDLSNFRLVTKNRPGILKELSLSNNEFTFLKSRLFDVKEDGSQEVLIDFTVRGKFEPIPQLTTAAVQPLVVPWFPKRQSDLNKIGYTLMQLNEEHNKDSPQFKDELYRKRRSEIARKALQFKIGQPFPTVDYNQQEHKTWQFIYGKLKALNRQGMCSVSNRWIEDMQHRFGLTTHIPQLGELDEYLRQKSNFRIKPTHGIVNQREFLNCLAFRRFCCTQYIRHWSIPQYTPEPDIVHEIVGHVPMFADKRIADFSQELGLLSLGASDEVVRKLGTLYWYTIEFGVIKEEGRFRGYGAGIGSSFGQLENLLSDKPRFSKLNVEQDSVAQVKVQDIQDNYRYVQNFSEMMQELREFGERQKGIHFIYNEVSREIESDRAFKAI